MATKPKTPKLVKGVNLDELFATVDAVKGTPTIAQFRFRVENQWQGASQNCSTVGNFFGANQEHARKNPFVLTADEPPVLPGSDGAANPVEYLPHALAACMTTSMVYHAAARGIRLEQIESTFEGDLDRRGFLGLDPKIRRGYQAIGVSFKVKADVPEEQVVEEIVQLAKRPSPVFDSLTNGVPVLVHAERLEP